MTLAPIALFTYNRPWHTQQTVEALQKNELAAQSDLIIFSDAAKNNHAKAAVNEVRAYLKTINGFRSVRIIEQETNQGLAHSIIHGVTQVVNEYGKIIVLEDDIVTSPYFLRFMNEALDLYQDKEKVWHISGWSYPIATDGLGDVFLWRVMNCWGWATWKDRWQHFDKNPQRLMADWSPTDIHRFDLDGSGVFWSQVLANAKGNLNTWAIFWYATIFENRGLCVNPSISYVDNIGLDGSGEHCGAELADSRALADESVVHFSSDISECSEAVERVKQYYQARKKSLPKRVIHKLLHIVGLR